MNNLYLDTNFFLYLSDKSSHFYPICKRFVRYCQKNNILISTSAETIQEIIHYTKNIKQLEKGLKAAKKTLEIIDELLPVTKETIKTYLRYALKYNNASSRDLIHMATCVENKIEKAVTFDKDFSKFKEIKTFQPQNAIFT